MVAGYVLHLEVRNLFAPVGVLAWFSDGRQFSSDLLQFERSL